MAEEGYQLFAGYVNDEPIAVAGVTISTNFYLGRHAYVYDLVVDENNRSKGYGAELLEYVHNWAADNDCVAVELESGLWREDAHRFYLDLDYEKNTATHLNMTSSNNQTDLCYASATALAADIRRGERSPVAVVDAFLDRIERVNPEINAYVTVCSESAREAAREAERAVERGDDIGPLHGVPVAIKDLNRVAGVRTTFGSPAFADHVPEHDDVVVSRLREAGAIILGKTNTPEFGRKTKTDNPVFGASGNPWDPSRTTGGSSGGSAAAVAAGLAPIALGSDAAGSIRIPSSACGVFGFLPDFGRVPAGPVRSDAFQDLLPYTFLGPIARTVSDAALMIEAISGPDTADPNGLPTPTGSYRDAVESAP